MSTKIFETFENPKYTQASSLAKMVDKRFKPYSKNKNSPKQTARKPKVSQLEHDQPCVIYQLHQADIEDDIKLLSAISAKSSPFNFDDKTSINHNLFKLELEQLNSSIQQEISKKNKQEICFESRVSKTIVKYQQLFIGGKLFLVGSNIKFRPIEEREDSLTTSGIIHSISNKKFTVDIGGGVNLNYSTKSFLKNYKLIF